MLEWEWNKITIDKYSTNQEILSLLIAQMIKDFESCGLALNLYADSTANHIKETVFAVLYKDIRSLHPKIHQLLYRIDISESHVAEIANHNDFNHFVHSLTDLIIKRELKKVLMKKYYQ